MNRKLVAYLQQYVELDERLLGAGWTSEPESYTKSSLGWSVELAHCKSISQQSIPQVAQERRTNLHWFVQAHIDSDEQEFERPVLRWFRPLMRRITAAGDGILREEDFVWDGRQKIYLAGSEGSQEDEIPAGFRLTWWYQNGDLEQRRRLVAALLQVLGNVAPDAMPQRWGDTEPPTETLASNGLEGLEDYIIARTTGQMPTGLLVQVTSPFAHFNIGPVRCLGERYPREGALATYEYGVGSLTIVCESAFLSESGDRAQIERLFREISHTVQPFYAEARLRTIALDTPSGTQIQVMPTEPANWRGIPRTPPYAMVIGPPYRGFWHATSGDEERGLVFYGDWKRSPEEGGTVARAPEPFLQEFDPRFGTASSADYGPNAEVNPTPVFGPSLQHSRRVPEIWPFVPRQTDADDYQPEAPSSRHMR